MNAAATTLKIVRGMCRTLRATHGGWLSVCAGRPWVTVEGDPEDYWLAPGEALPVAPGERVWIGGWDEAVVCEWCAPLAAEYGPLEPQPLDALRAWLGRQASSVALWPRRTRIGALRAIRTPRGGGYP
jgi:hypothetical protein